MPSVEETVEQRELPARDDHRAVEGEALGEGRPVDVRTGHVVAGFRDGSRSWVLTTFRQVGWATVGSYMEGRLAAGHGADALAALFMLAGRGRWRIVWERGSGGARGEEAQSYDSSISRLAANGLRHQRGIPI